MDRVPSLRQPRVGANVGSDHRRGNIIALRLMTWPTYLMSVERKDAARTGNLLIIDGNQVWDGPQAIEYVIVLAEIKPWFTEEPDEYVLPLCLPLPFAPFCVFPLPFIIKMTPSQQHPCSCQHPA